MATPTPEGEPFAESMAEAVQTSVMAVRLLMAVADAVRRHQQRRQKGKEEDLPTADEAVGEAAEGVKNLLPPDISEALMKGADWPQMAQQLVALRRAGVDLADFLPLVGEVAAGVRDQVAANAERVAREGTGEWERTLRETLPAGPVREAILSSPTWPDITATMARLDERGVDVRQILASAHDEGVGVDQAVARVLAAGSAPATSEDALRSYGELTIGLDIPKNLELADRERALQKQLAISPSENGRFIRMMREAMPGRERDADLLVNHRQWPLIAYRMARMESDGKPVKEHLARLMKDTGWEKEPGKVGSRLVEAASEALRRPPGDAPTESRVKVNTEAARASSATVGPTKPTAAKSAAPAKAGVAPHRETGTDLKSGKTR